jgi:hypothetical protein
LPAAPVLHPWNSRSTTTRTQDQFNKVSFFSFSRGGLRTSSLGGDDGDIQTKQYQNPRSARVKIPMDVVVIPCITTVLLGTLFVANMHWAKKKSISKKSQIKLFLRWDYFLKVRAAEHSLLASHFQDP